MSAIGEDPDGGLTRLLYSGSWKEAQETLRDLFTKAGLAARYDEVGNLFGRIEGTDMNCGTVLTGSHVDTVRNGGTLDGQYGILASYLAVKRLITKFGAPKRSLEVVSFAEEEGSRFPYVFWGSKNLVGINERGKLREVKDADGKLFTQAMSEAGFDFEAVPEIRKDIEAFIEIHIEQGGVLEHLGKQIGVVTAIAGQKRYNVKLVGEANHAGTTPMSMRRDAMVCAARCMTLLTDNAKKLGDPLVLTFGRVDLKPNTANVVPGEVSFSVDTRHTDRAILNNFAVEIENVIRSTAGEMGLVAELACWMNEPPVPMDIMLTELLTETCKENGLDFQMIHSGAGHDSQIMAPVYPTAMLFVPSIKGISHNPNENTRMEDLAAGVDALEAALRKLAYE
jgi:allantoate deiminase